MGTRLSHGCTQFSTCFSLNVNRPSNLDCDSGSGLISYDEFVEMVRNDLKLSARALPENQMQRAWLALDTDCSGYLSSGEFGAFMRLAAPQPDRRSPIGSPRGISAPRRAPPGLPESTFLIYSSRDAKKLRAQTDAQVERDLRISRTRFLLGGSAGMDGSPGGRSSPPRPQSSPQGYKSMDLYGRIEDTRDVRALQHQLMLAQAQVRRLEQMMDLKKAQCAAADGSDEASATTQQQQQQQQVAGGEASGSLAALLANASRFEMEEAVGALTPAQRQLLHDITRAES